MQVKNWRLRKLILFWIVAVAQVWIVISILTKPFPLKPESNGYWVIFFTVLMLGEFALSTSVAMLAVTWKWLHARKKGKRSALVDVKPRTLHLAGDFRIGILTFRDNDFTTSRIFPQLPRNDF
jgi:hypothetical protein